MFAVLLVFHCYLWHFERNFSCCCCCVTVYCKLSRFVVAVVCLVFYILFIAYWKMNSKRKIRVLKKCNVMFYWSVSLLSDSFSVHFTIHKILFFIYLMILFSFNSFKIDVCKLCLGHHLLPLPYLDFTIDWSHHFFKFLVSISIQCFSWIVSCVEKGRWEKLWRWCPNFVSLIIDDSVLLCHVYVLVFCHFKLQII